MCLSVKTFHDGDRLVISIDGLPRQSSEDIAKIFLAGLVTDTKAVNDATAAPVLPEKEKLPETNFFEEGPFKGMSPEQIMEQNTEMKDKEKVCAFFASNMDSVDESMRRAIIMAGRKYLKLRFKGCDADTYGDKLNDGQLLTFFTRYVPFIDGTTKKLLLKKFHRINWNDFLFQDNENLREAVPVIIKSFL